MSAAKGRELPSTWFAWHASLFHTGVRVLDLACGRGRHAVAAAERGARVVAVDADRDRLKAAEKLGRQARVQVEWIQLDLTGATLPTGPFDVVMQFSYLDRARLPEFLAAVKPGGYFLAETFLEEQRELGWGPTSDAHLLKPWELMHAVEPFELVAGREVMEVLDGHPRAVASVLARRPGE